MSLIFALFAGSFSQSAPPTKVPAKADASDQPVIIEELSTSVRYENDGTSIQTARQKTKIQNEAGLRIYGIITFSFIAGDDLSIDTVEVHKKDGSIVKAGAANIQEVTPEISREAPMYSDVRQKQVTVPGLSVGDEVLFQFTLREKPLVPGQFWFDHSFTKDVVVLSESVSLDVPKDRKLHLKFQPGYKPESKSSGDRMIYQWHAANDEIAKAKKSASQNEQLEGMAPPPSIELSTFESWDQVGTWYYGLQHERSIPTEAIKAKANELTKGLDSDEAKAKALYQYVSLNFRYISLDFGIGRYQPHAADEVLANKYGDCKDKHTLLAALLEAVGIHAYPVLISSHRSVDQDVPSPGQFDHLFTSVRLQKNTLFLDTTAEIAPYGMLVPQLRHKKALVITGPQSQEFAETPDNPPFTAQETFDLKGKIDESGTMEADVDYYLHGDSEILLKAILRRAPPAKHTEMVQGLSYYSGFGGEVSQVKISGLEDLDHGLRITYHYHRPDYLDFHDQFPKNALPLAFSRFPRWETDEDSVRLYFSPGELVYRCRVELPAGVSIQAPINVKLDRDYLRYASSYSVDKNVISGEKRIEILKPQVSGDHRSDYEAFQKSLVIDEVQNMLVHLPEGFVAKSAPASSADLDELMQRAQIELRERNYNDAYADFRKIAERDPKRKGIWTQLAAAEATMGRVNQAIGDYQKAIAADPFDAEAHAGLGSLYLIMRKPEAVDELKKAVEIDPLNHRAHYLLGWHYSIMAQDSTHAVPELEKAMATEGPQFNDAAQISQLLSDEYFKQKQFDKGVELVKHSVEAAPNPVVWNNAAFALADNDQALDLAQQYADSALKGIYDVLNQLDPGSIRKPELLAMTQLAMTWDTMGWIHFKNGRLELAEKYVRAAWILAQDREVAEHLGEIYEKMKRPADAAHYYALSVSAFHSASTRPNKGRTHLIKLVGAQRAEDLIRSKVNEPSQSRTIHLGNIAPPEAKGQFYVVFGPGPKVIAVQLFEGDDSLTAKLRKLDDKIAASVVFPEDAPQKLVREAFVVCSSYSRSCDLVFNLSDMPTPGAAMQLTP